MQPIVHGLGAEYGAQIKVVELNAMTGGEAAFTKSGLPGHPGFIILLPDGQEQYRAFGLLKETDLRTAIEDAARKLSASAITSR